MPIFDEERAADATELRFTGVDTDEKDRLETAAFVKGLHTSASGDDDDNAPVGEYQYEYRDRWQHRRTGLSVSRRTGRIAAVVVLLAMAASAAVWPAQWQVPVCPLALLLPWCLYWAAMGHADATPARSRGTARRTGTPTHAFALRVSTHGIVLTMDGRERATIALADIANVEGKQRLTLHLRDGTTTQLPFAIPGTDLGPLAARLAELLFEASTQRAGYRGDAPG